MKDVPNSIVRISGRGIPMPGNDIDTDRIIPARFMRCVTFDDLGKYAFYDERFDAGGSPLPHPMNDPKYTGGSILITGKNFGCGSSREHAPQSLHRTGIKALIAESYAEIFHGNCTMMGIPAVTVSHEDREVISRLVEENPDVEITVDVERCVIITRGTDPVELPCSMNEGYRLALTSGRWDTTSLLLENINGIKKTAAGLPYMAQ